MDAGKWKKLREMLFDNMGDILKDLLSADWTRETNKAADRLLTKKLEQYAKELGYPPLPNDKVYHAHLSFKDGPNGKVPKISTYYAPRSNYTRGPARPATTQPTDGPKEE